ncbi:ABC transporter substrate-binding protein [Roseibium sp. SCP14]|uniref:ABC transporter substrate-binding protein n=1 Tax=Roseibium sp. SCP14 TaxID=3141375 RepID=UPI003337720E
MTVKMTRRTAAKMIGGAIGGALAAPMILGRAAAANPVKVGMIYTTSGVFASSGDIMSKSAKLFLKHEAPAILGDHTIELIERDDTGPNPDVAKRLATELITRDRVNFIAGLQWTPNTNAIAPVLTAGKTPGVIMNATGAVTTRLSPYLVRFSQTLWQSCYYMGVWAARNRMKKAYVLVTDFSPGHDAEAAFHLGFTESGGEVIEQVRMPIRNPDFTPFLQRVLDANPDALFCFNPGGPQATTFMRAYAELGLRDKGIKLIGSGYLTGDDELPNMGAAAEGVFTSHFYSAAAERPANQHFRDLWQAEYGDVLWNELAIGTWDGMAAICQAVAETNGADDSDAVIESLRRFWTKDSPRGTVQIDSETRDIIQNIYIREVKMVDGVPQNIEFETFESVKDPWKERNPA